MTTTALGGVVCPLATPLTDDEKVDEQALRALVEYLVPNLDGILALGSSGEYALLEQSVAQRVIDVVLDQVASRIPVFVGVGDTGTRRAIANCRRFARPGVAAVVVTSSFYYPLADQEALARHFLEVAESSTLPTVLYNIPQNTATNLAPSTLPQLAEHRNIVGLKDSWGDMFQFQEFLGAAPSGFPVMQGREQLAAASMWLGASGIISAIANFAPEQLQELIRAVEQGDRDAAIQVQRRLTEVARLFDERYWLSALKAAVAGLGFGSGRTAAPLRALDDEERARVAKRLREAGIRRQGVTTRG